MSQQRSSGNADYLIKSYRYLRLAIVVMAATVFVSVGIEVLKATCIQTSISSYYYTPAHAVFIAALAGIGISLVAITGKTDSEDAWLNVAGLLAPVVAFVPTAPSSHDCPSVFLGSSTAEFAFPPSYLRNNLMAYVAGGAIALLAAYVLAKVQKKSKRLVEPTRHSVGGGLAGVALGVAGILWYFGWRSNFLSHAHSYSAIAMFAAIGVVVYKSARDSRTSATYKPIYAGCAIVMAVSFASVTIVSWVTGWRHAVLWLEVLESAPFVVFWLSQSLEYWDEGVPPGAPTAA